MYMHTQFYTRVCLHTQSVYTRVLFVLVSHGMHNIGIRIYICYFSVTISYLFGFFRGFFPAGLGSVSSAK